MGSGSAINHTAAWSSPAGPDQQLWCEERTLESEICSHHIYKRDLVAACQRDTKSGTPMRNSLSVSKTLLSSAMFHKNSLP